MYNFEDLISDNGEKAIYVDKNNPNFDKFINLLTESNYKWYSGDSLKDLIYDKTYYVIHSDNYVAYLSENQLEDTRVIVHLDEIAYKDEKEMDIDIETLL